MVFFYGKAQSSATCIIFHRRIKPSRTVKLSLHRKLYIKNSILYRKITSSLGSFFKETQLFGTLNIFHKKKISIPWDCNFFLFKIQYSGTLEFFVWKKKMSRDIELFEFFFHRKKKQFWETCEFRKISVPEPRGALPSLLTGTVAFFSKEKTQSEGNGFYRNTQFTPHKQISPKSDFFYRNKWFFSIEKKFSPVLEYYRFFIKKKSCPVRTWHGNFYTLI